MSYYTRFADVEASLTASTTTVFGSTDVLLGFSFTTNKYHAVTGAGLTPQAGSLQALTSASTGTNIVPFGITTIASSNALSYLLTAPTVAGVVKYIVSSSTAVVTVVASAAQILSSGAAQGTQFIFNGAGAAIAGGAVTLVSLGTTRWSAFTAGAITLYT